MPIRKDLKHLYPPNWKEISHRIRFERANGECEWCGAPHGYFIVREDPNSSNWRLYGLADEAAALEGHKRVDCVRVILTTAHLDHDPTNNDESNLAALCQRCHLKYDMKQHVRNARATRIRKRRAQAEAVGQKELWEDGA